MVALLRHRALYERMRRGGASFSPSQIAGLQLWLKADAIVGLSDGDPVATWSDSGGLGNDATQGTPARQPLYKVNIQNGLPVVRFDGTDDTIGHATLAARAAQTVAIVGVKRSAPTTNLRRYVSVNISSTVAQVTARSTNSATNWCWNQNQANGVSDLAITCQAWHDVVVVVASASSLSAYADGTLGAAIDPRDAVTTGTGFQLASISDGGTGACDVDIGEAILYNAALSDADRGSLEGYLRAKWATP